MSKPGSAVKDATPREAINNAAIRLFGAQGYNGTTMRDIAQEVGILAGSLYAHIDSKENLLAEIVQIGIEPYLEIFRSLEGVAAVGAGQHRRGIGPRPGAAAWAGVGWGAVEEGALRAFF